MCSTVYMLVIILPSLYPQIVNSKLFYLVAFNICIPGFPGGSEVKMSACKAEDLGSIPGLGSSPGEGNGNPFQYSCLENPMDICMHTQLTIYFFMIIYIRSRVSYSGFLYSPLSFSYIFFFILLVSWKLIYSFFCVHCSSQWLRK